MWDLPRPELEPVSPTLAGRFLTTAPPGKPWSIFNFSYLLFITVCLLFSSSRSLLNVSCIFSILFPRFWIIFTIITLNSFSRRLPVSSSFIWSCRFLPCSFVCNVFFCCLTFLMGGVVFLCYWLFGLRHPALAFAGSWVELGLGAQIRTSG